MKRPPKAEIMKAIQTARGQLQKRQFSQAAVTLVTLQKKYGPSPIVYNLQAQARMGQGKQDEAIACLRKSLDMMPKQAEVLNNLALMLFETKQYAEGLEKIEAAIEAADKPGRFAANAARLFYATEQLEKAEFYADLALNEDPNNPTALSVRGFVADLNTDADTAREAYQAVLEQQPANADVHFALSCLLTYTPDHSHIGQMRAALSGGRLSPMDEGQIRFGLGNALESAGQYKEACDEFIEANRLRRSQMPFDIDAERARFQHIAQDLPGRDEGLTTHEPLRNRRPLFIVGLPRSGTTLTEQILGGHSQVLAKGELGAMLKAVNEIERQPGHPMAEWLFQVRSYYLSQTRPPLDEDVTWYTDKRPINFRNVGYILSAMPESKVIHVRRHPFHTCWSIFKRPFAGDGAEFTNNLDDLVAYYALYDTLMEEWSRQFPDRFLTVVYEDLVQDPQKQTDRMLAFLDLAPEDGLLDYHEREQFSGTASRYQVQEGIVTNSADKAERFRPFVPEFAAALDALQPKTTDD